MQKTELTEMKNKIYKAEKIIGLIDRTEKFIFALENSSTKEIWLSISEDSTFTNIDHTVRSNLTSEFKGFLLQYLKETLKELQKALEEL